MVAASLEVVRKSACDGPILTGLGDEDVGHGTDQKQGKEAAVAAWNSRPAVERLVRLNGDYDKHLRGCWAGLKKMRKPTRLKGETVLHEDSKEAGAFLESLHQSGAV